ncbi:MAG TPA: XrtA/PEP-CTERM system TPR-repeat protein PrsT [Rhodocyclaceae bacterium]|nr:XrtA/PEP-CTERM system TPR-repeat protein PrsT [Rhodocyclaceae bacterium]
MTSFQRHPWLTVANAFVHALALCVALGVGPVHADADKASRYYEDGQTRFDRNDIAGAIIQLKNALQQDSHLLAAHVLLGKALLKNGDVSAAEAAFNEALKQGVSREEVAVPLAQVYMLQGRAQSVIERARPDDLPTPARVEILSLRGRAYAEMGNLIDADHSFESARLLDPNSVVPLLAEVPVLLSTGKHDRAKQLADRAVVLAPNNADAWNMEASVAHANLDLNTALAGYGKALLLDPKHVDARVARASILLDQQRDQDAQADLDELKRVAPNDARAAYLRALLAGRRGQSNVVADALRETARNVDSLPREWVASRDQFLMLGALAYNGLGQQEKARAYLDTLINRNGHNAAARKLLTSIYLDGNDFVRAGATIEPLLRDTPNDPVALYLMGRSYLGQKRYVQASEYLERAIQLGADTAEVRAAIGFSQLGSGQGPQGLKSLEASFAKKPGEPSVGLALATQYMRMGNTKQAVAVAETVVSKNANNIAALNLLGAVKAASNDRAGARKAYEQVLASNADFTPAILNLAKLDEADGKPDDARKRLQGILAKRRDDGAAMYELGLLEQRSAHPLDAQRWFERARAAQPKDPRAGIALVELLLSQHAAEPALNAARDLSAAFDDNLEVMATLGRAQVVAGDRAGAIQTFKDMTKLAEYDAPMQVRIGRLQMIAGSLDGAAYNAQKALTSTPGDAGALLLQGDVLLAQHDYAKAETSARELVAKFPAGADGYRLAGDVAMARNQFSLAAQSYRSALEHASTSENARRVARAYLLSGDAAKASAFLEQWLSKHANDIATRSALAEVDMRQGNWNQAKLQYQQVLNAGDDVSALNNLALVQLRLKDSTAAATAGRAVKLAPQDPNTLDTLGWILVQQGQLDGGLRYLRDARLRAPESPELRYHLAFALAKLGHQAEAKTELDYGLKDGASFDGVEDARQLQKELTH